MNNYILLTIFIVSHASSYNILCIFPYPSRSHFFSFQRLAKELALRGHNVTVISHFPRKDPIQNYRDIAISETEFASDKRNGYRNIDKINPKGRYLKYMLPLMRAEVAHTVCEKLFKSEILQNFLKEGNHFDLSLIEFMTSDCCLTLIKKIDVPVVRVSTFSLTTLLSKRHGNPHNPAYIPNNLLPFCSKMNFLERVENTLLTFFENVCHNGFVIVQQDKKIVEKYFGELSNSFYSDIFNSSLLLVNSHYTVNFPRPLVPNVIEVGGIHIDTPNSMPKVRQS